jgi:hypothetical protein
MIPMSRPTNLNNQVEFEELDRAIARANDEFERRTTRQMVRAWWDDLPEEEKEERRFRDRVETIANEEKNKFCTKNFEEASSYLSCTVKMVFSDGKPDTKYVCNMFSNADKKPEDLVKDVEGKAKIYITWSDPKPRITEEPVTKPEKPVVKEERKEEEEEEEPVTKPEESVVKKKARKDRSVLSKVCGIANKLAVSMDRRAAFKKAWRIVKSGAVRFPVAGVTFENRQEMLKWLARHDSSKIHSVLIPEQTKFDKDAVAVMASVQNACRFLKIGYIPRSEASVAKAFLGKVPQVEIIGGDILGARLSIAV